MPKGKFLGAADLQADALTEKEKRSIEIFEILRRRGPISRPDISKEIGVNVVTVSNYLDEFIKHKLVDEKEFDVSEGGRRPLLVDLNAQAGYVIGVGLNLSNMVGILVDLKGNIITKTQISRPRATVQEITEYLLEIVREIFRRSKEYARDIKGVGVGVAGLINKQDGSIHWPQKMNHYYTYASVDLPLKELIEKEFSLPALIENDASAACLGEYLLNLDSSARNVLYMFSGVGCGLILNGELYTGSSGYAGEVSIYNFKEQDDFNCEASRGCFLKRTDMDLGMVEEMRGMLERDRQAADRFYKLTGTNSGNIELRSIFNAMRANEPLALKCLDNGARRLGIRIASIVNLLNPEVVIIGGGLEEAGDKFLNRVIETVKGWAFREDVQDLKIIYSQLRENAVALGAASLVIRKVFARML